MPTAEELRASKASVLAEITAILVTYNYKESDIPQRHNYWKLLNVYRTYP
jgi:hypothetical protein